jgi:hypothetical protein
VAVRRLPSMRAICPKMLPLCSVESSRSSPRIRILTFTEPLRTMKQLLPGLPCLNNNVPPGRSQRHIVLNSSLHSASVNSWKPGSEHSDPGSTLDEEARFASETWDEKSPEMEDIPFENTVLSGEKEIASEICRLTACNCA